MNAGFVTSDLLGYAAAALVLITFLAQSMVTLRAVAIASNVMFLIYALVAGLPPVLTLHALLLPLNAWRLWQAARSQPRMREPVEPRLVLRAPTLASFRAGPTPIDPRPPHAAHEHTR
jgi:CRP/FNR family transcriptional regulator, cyclic AMP receptor protein